MMVAMSHRPFLPGLLLCAWLMQGMAVASPVQQARTAPPPPTIHANASLVLVDVVVTSDGKAVEGLPERQFRIFEDGRQQPLTVFEEHRAGESPVAASEAALPPGVYSNRPRFAIDSAANVLLLDALNTPLSDQQNARRQLLDYVKRMPAGTRLAVFTLGSRLQMVSGFTANPAALRAALVRGKYASRSSVLLESPQEEQQLDDAATVMGGVDAGALQQFEADTKSLQTDERVRMTLDALDTLGRYLAQIPGRKNLIWFSGSFPIQIDFDPSLDPGSSAASSQMAQNSSGHVSPLNPFSTMRDYSADLQQADNLLALARVAVYPVDARGLTTLASVDSSRDFSSSSPLGPLGGGSGRGGPSGRARGSGEPAMDRADDQFLGQNMVEHLAMSQIAEETGGKVIVNSNGLSDAAADAIQDGSSYYTLGYVPAREKWDGKFRRIKVQVAGGHYGLAYRRGYFAEDSGTASAPAPGMTAPIVAALARGAPPLSQILFEARALAASDPAAKAVEPQAGPAGKLTLKPPVQRYLVDFSVDPHGLAWTAAPGGSAHAEFELVMVAWNEDGQRVNYTDQAFGPTLNPRQSAAALRSGIPLHQEIDLPPGRIYLHLAIHDLRNQHIGAMEIPLNVPKP